MSTDAPRAAAIGTLDPGAAAAWLADSPAALAGASAAGGLLWANPACSALCGGLVAGLPLAVQLALDAGDAARLQHALGAGGSADVRARAAGWLRVAVNVTSDGLRLLALSDIGPLKAAEAEAQRDHDLLALARSQGRIGVWDRDIATGHGHWDEVVFRMRGLDVTGPDAPPFDVAKLTVLEADRPAFEAAFQSSLKAVGSYSHRYRVLTPQGEIRQLQSQWLVRDGDDGRPASVLGLIMDDTQAWSLARSYDELVSQLALAVDLAGIAIWRHDIAAGRIQGNEQAFALFGLAPRPGGVTVDEVLERLHPVDRDAVVAAVDTVLAGHQAVDAEVRVRRGDGAWRTVMMRRTAQRGADGRNVAMVGVALDITERIDDSRRAAELARRFELATRTAGIGYWSLDHGQEHMRWNEQLRAIHGIAAGAPVPTMREWLAGFVHPDDRAAVRERFANWLHGDQPALESNFRIVCHDGGVRDLITHSLRERGEPLPLLFGLVIDVSERRAAEMALRRANERAALAARGAGLGAWEVDLRTDTAYWDEQMWHLRGLTPRAEPPGPAERLALVHPDDRDAAHQRATVPLDDPAPSNHEFRVVLPDGRVRWLASRSVAVRDEQGHIVRRIGVNWDITDRRNAETVQRARELALRESESKSRFLARMSHELRTPLNAVLGFAQLLLAEDGSGGGDDAAAQRRRRVEHIRSAGQHLLELINDVLELSSLESGELRIAMQPVPLAPVLQAALPLIEPLRREHRVELVVGALDVVPLADATRLRQVLLNLLSNAVKYNRAGGSVAVDAERRGSQVHVRIADTGLGLDAAQRRHLFEPFNRLGREGQSIPGTGIGLAIVKALVERMGGSIHVESEAGVGSVFELRLADASSRPLPEEAPVQATLPAALHAAGARPRGTLLYIEDNPVNALIIAELIARRPDLKLHIAVDGSSGVHQAQQLQPDLVLLDMQLPDFDGHEVLRRLRADARTAAIPVIALSANAMPEDIERALHAGMADYWTKPLDFRAFMASLDALFGAESA